METLPVDICILCALFEEARAFIDTISALCKTACVSRFSARYLYNYQLATIQNNRGEPLTLHISWLPRYGPQEMTLHLSHVLEEFRPRFVGMSGICAGDKRQVALGDLVVAERVFFSDNGKFTVDVHGNSLQLHDTITHQPDENTLRFAHAFTHWKPLVKRLKPPLPRHQTQVHIKPMTSGNAVRSDYPFQAIQIPVRGAVAIDMEGAAFGHVMTSVLWKKIPWLVVKGVSDFADREKNDAYHRYASRASARYLLCFIKEYVTSERLPSPVNVQPVPQPDMPLQRKVAITSCTCVISYSLTDQAFAEQLYADLQRLGVRVWFAPEDFKIGDKMRIRIDEIIHSYDKLLLVLSRHSLASQWVEFEVEAALDKEACKRTLTLFPIRLDNAVLNMTTGWAAHIRRTRFIGSFEHWQQPAEYQRALGRLLRDLQTEITVGG